MSDDLISRTEAINTLKNYFDMLRKTYGVNVSADVEYLLGKLPTCSPTFKPIAEIRIDSEEVVEMVLEKIKNGEWIISSDSAEHYEWCHDCKEYDQENHCCHRYSSFIQESLQDNIDAVLEDIKAEMECFKKDNHTFEYGGFDTAFDGIMGIIDKHISGKEQE